MHFKREHGQEIDGKKAVVESPGPLQTQTGGWTAASFFFGCLRIVPAAPRQTCRLAHDVAAVNWQSSGSGTTDPDNRSKQWPGGSLCLVGGQSKAGGTLDRRPENGSTWQLHAPCSSSTHGEASQGPESETRLAGRNGRQGPRALMFWKMEGATRSGLHTRARFTVESEGGKYPVPIRFQTSNLVQILTGELLAISKPWTSSWPSFGRLPLPGWTFGASEIC